MARHQALAEAKQARHLAVQSGSGKTDTVQQSSAAKAFLTRLDVELRSGSGGHFGDRLLQKGRCGSALARRKLD
jgi:hypothetical protein